MYWLVHLRFSLACIRQLYMYMLGTVITPRDWESTDNIKIDGTTSRPQTLKPISCCSLMTIVVCLMDWACQSEARCFPLMCKPCPSDLVSLNWPQAGRVCVLHNVVDFHALSKDLLGRPEVTAMDFRNCNCLTASTLYSAAFYRLLFILVHTPGIDSLQL
ncbi:uncharacterized protein LOC124717327 [Schistocerca piceifrons]|uniref:uncharacterized protein LOC124717327 n=1 Tax=Schistocerca piceifrons TaxID=274613 RepID=UPI001F5F8420|nr:uncharacterized protein LOC124717327 [Schistocerca piceifrons]